MTVPTIEEYVSNFDTAASTVTAVTDAGTTEGWWLLVIHSAFIPVNSANGRGFSLPKIEGEDWRLISEVRNRNGTGPIQRVWVMQVTSSGAQTVTAPPYLSDSALSTGEAHTLHVYVLSDVREYQAFRCRTTRSTISESSQEAGGAYCPDSDGLLIGVWNAGGSAFNYGTSPDGMTGETEVDTGMPSCSRAWHENLAASGPTGSRTAGASVGLYWVATLIIVSGPQGAITFPTSKLTFRMELALGADLAAHPDDWEWTDATSDVLYRDKIKVVTGRGDQSAEVTYSVMGFTFKNPTGKYSSRAPASPYYGLLRPNTPVRFWVNPGSGFAVRFSGFIPAWTPRWTTGQDRWVPVVAYGILYRLGQGTPPVESQYRRSILGARAEGLLGYWAIEDEVGADTIASTLPGGTAMTTKGAIEFAALDTFVDVPDVDTQDFSRGTKPIANFAGGGRATFRLPVGTASPVEWSAECVVQADAVDAGEDIVIMHWDTPGGTQVRWEFAHDSASGYQVAGYNSAGTRTNLLTLAVSFGLALIDVSVQAIQNGSNIDIQLVINGVIQDSDSIAGTLAWPIGGMLNPAANVITGDTGLYIGHVRFWQEEDPPQIAYETPFYDDYGVDVTAFAGYLNEAATERLQRLCEEDGVLLDAFQVDPNSVIRMDSQLPGTRLELYRQCAATDGGVLHESEFGLGLVPRVYRYNNPIGLRLDYDERDLFRQPEPADDDFGLVNSMTVARAGGSAETYTDETGVRGTAAVGLYEGDALTLNIAPGESLYDRASMEVAIGTADELRWPTLSLDFYRKPEHIPAWLDLPTQGARIEIVNPPDNDTGPDTVDLIREGWAEVFDQISWTAEPVNCSPQQPWRIFRPESTEGNTGRVGSRGIEVATFVSANRTTIPVVRGDEAWKSITTDSGDYPIGLLLLDENYSVGEVIIATAVAAVTLSGATGTADTDVNAAVTAVLPSHAEGDALYLLAAVRNSGAGTPDKPAGWDYILDPLGEPIFPLDSNVALFGRIAASSADTNPTVTFSGSVAGADTFAVVHRLRGGTLHCLGAASQLNASAANIDTPAVTWNPRHWGPATGSVFVFVIGWKQDDSTGVATLSGATELIDTSMTAGDDMTVVWDRDAAELNDGAYPAMTFTVSGGANAISRGAACVFRIAEHNLTVSRSVNGAAMTHEQGTHVQLYRPARIAL